MAFTRFSNDVGVQEKRLEESVFSGIYALNTPGNGMNNPYIDDVHIRLQKWGGNLYEKSTNIESELRTMHIKPDRDYKIHPEKQHYKKSYPSKHFSVDETRATLPAWKFRNHEQTIECDHLHKDPQTNIFIPFQHNLNTRTLEKDYYNKNKK